MGGSVANTTNGRFNLIEADKPITVAQFCTSEGQDNNPSYKRNFIGGDPEMIYLSPVEQTINKITLYSSSAYQISQSYINVIIPKAGVQCFTMDGVKRASNFKKHPSDSAYYYAIFSMSSGSHTLFSNIRFNAIAYGFGSAESYGYNAGTNIIDLYQYATVNFPATCREAPFILAITLPYNPSKLFWDFKGNASLIPNDNVIIDNPVPDSVYVKDKKTLYRFRLPLT